MIRHFGVCKHINFSFSQEGEDLIVDSLLGSKEKGFYVDFGAYKPDKYSNTLRFYVQGWNGLNIDATPGSMKAFKKLRPRDINIECGISDKEDEMVYFQFDEPALNTFDEMAAKSCERAGYKLIRKTYVNTHTPMFLMDRYVPEDTKIDVMDIDIEGFDNLIVDSIDWSKYKPTIVMIEKKMYDRSNVMISNEVLTSNGYQLVACTHRTAMYMDIVD